MYSIIQYFSLSSASQMNISTLGFSFNCPRYKKAKNKQTNKHVVPNHCQFLNVFHPRGLCPIIVFCLLGVRSQWEPVWWIVEGWQEVVSCHYILSSWCSQSMRTGMTGRGRMTRSCFLSLYFVFLVFAVNENWYDGSWKNDKKLFPVIVFCLLGVRSQWELVWRIVEEWQEVVSCHCILSSWCSQSMRTGMTDRGRMTRSCFLSLCFVFLLFAVNENWYDGSWKDDKKLFPVIVFCLLGVRSQWELVWRIVEDWQEVVSCHCILSSCCLYSMRTGMTDRGRLTRSCFLSLYFVFLLFVVNENRYGGLWKLDKKLFPVIVFCLLVVCSHWEPVRRIVEGWQKLVCCHCILSCCYSQSSVFGLVVCSHWELVQRIMEAWREVVSCHCILSSCCLQSLRTGMEDYGRMTKSCLLSLHFVFLLFTVQCIWTCCFQSVRTGTEDCGSLTRSCLMSL